LSGHCNHGKGLLAVILQAAKIFIRWEKIVTMLDITDRFA